MFPNFKATCIPSLSYYILSFVWIWQIRPVQNTTKFENICVAVVKICECYWLCLQGRYPLLSFQNALQVVGPLIGAEILKQYKLILKQILQTLSDISQGMYLNLSFQSLVLLTIFMPYKQCFKNFKILKWGHWIEVA